MSVIQRLVLTGVLVSPVAGYAQSCSLDQAAITSRIEDRARALIAQDVPARTRDVVMNTPLASPSAKQISAPTSAGAESTLTDGADFNRLLGIAVENGLATSSADGVTFDLNLFAFKAAVDRSVVESQAAYEQHAFMRRFSGSLTFGGKGDPVDSDGDGIPEAPLTPKSLADVVTLDLRFRLSKQSRDRRDPANYTLIQRRVAAAGNAVAVNVNAALVELARLGFDVNSVDCSARLDKLLSEMDGEKLRALGVSLGSVDGDYAAALAEIDARTLWTLALSGTEREREFGSDKLRLGVRGAMGGMGAGWQFSFDYGEAESLTLAEDPRSTKLAIAWKTTVFQGSRLPEGIEASLSAAVEHYDDVPDTLHDRVAKVNARLVYPLTRTVKIPLSITWANHADLVTDESDVRGNIGFTVDFDSLVDLR